MSKPYLALAEPTTHACWWPHYFGVSSPWNVCVFGVTLLKLMQAYVELLITNIAKKDKEVSCEKGNSGFPYNFNVLVWMKSKCTVSTRKLFGLGIVCQRKLNLKGNLCIGYPCLHSAGACICYHEAWRDHTMAIVYQSLVNEHNSVLSMLAGYRSFWFVPARSMSFSYTNRNVFYLQTFF